MSLIRSALLVILGLVAAASTVPRKLLSFQISHVLIYLTSFLSFLVDLSSTTTAPVNRHACDLLYQGDYLGTATLLSDSWLLTHAEHVPVGKTRYVDCGGQIRSWNYSDVHYLTTEGSAGDLALIRVTEAFQLNSVVFPIDLPSPALQKEDIMMLQLSWVNDPVRQESEEQYGSGESEEEDNEEQCVTEESEQEGNEESHQEDTDEEYSGEDYTGPPSVSQIICDWLNYEFASGTVAWLNHDYCDIVPYFVSCGPNYAVPVLGSLNDGTEVLVGIVRYINSCQNPAVDDFVRISDFLPQIEAVLSSERLLG